MKLVLHRSVRAAGALALALAFAAGTTGLVGGSTAQAQQATSASLSFSGDEGDYISGGQSYAYSTDAQDRLDVSASSDLGHVNVSVNGAHGDWWYLDLAAPSGQALKPGTYEGATRYPFNGAAEPGLSLDGNGRGCNTLTGSFTVSKADFGPNGYVEAFDATYEQHCEGGSAALRGEVHIANPAPPAQLGLGVDIAPDGTASTLNGKATVHGTVSCNKPVELTIGGTVTQVKKGVLIRGNYSTTADCTPGAAVAWSAQADPTGTTPFQKGDVEVSAQAFAADPDYPGQSVTDSETVAVHLAKG
ncbi:hypothetical protein [Streptomyces sp. TS71-3]|uniref:hypothetical protein n=1 Tax=Streptomyces sp. TS71-3 TaxID=2733862 RepID=UPI001B2A2282|nr:hypothetical protein [Streptomyces sp. TS71-3]GHJ36273.1 hypothetical protein Sm713_18820 [Streptomyces sp. TS71-3]